LKAGRAKLRCYNCPLAESAPFIFMNAAGQMHDVTTMVHEGHAIHSFLAHPLELMALKNTQWKLQKWPA